MPFPAPNTPVLRGVMPSDLTGDMDAAPPGFTGDTNADVPAGPLAGVDGPVLASALVANAEGSLELDATLNSVGRPGFSGEFTYGDGAETVRGCCGREINGDLNGLFLICIPATTVKCVGALLFGAAPAGLGVSGGCAGETANPFSTGRRAGRSGVWNDGGWDACRMTDPEGAVFSAFCVSEAEDVSSCSNSASHCFILAAARASASADGAAQLLLPPFSAAAELKPA